MSDRPARGSTHPRRPRRATGRRRPAVVLVAVLALLMTLAGCQGAVPTTPPPPATVPTAALERADVEAWLDGMLPAALARAGVAGAGVGVVHDGEVLISRGYGWADTGNGGGEPVPVDPARTLFRPGSVSKVVTATAVVQLVEQGQLDLDADVRGYLDFDLPLPRGAVSLRHLLTHTAGFEERIAGLIALDGAPVDLRRAVSTDPPEQVYAPGTVPAYSNYGNALAGYVVERVSGVRFEDHLRAAVLEPAGMTSSSFAQPLPPDLAGRVSLGYPDASAPAAPFEHVGEPPAGALSATVDDMSAFMLAQLGRPVTGEPLLGPEALELMHTPALDAGTLGPLAAGPQMTLGFFDESRNGRHILGHGGDTQFFHSHLQIYPDEGTGIFIALNSNGSGALDTIELRDALMRGFTDRYFPGEAAPVAGGVEAAEALEHARAAEGSYRSSRSLQSTFLPLRHRPDGHHPGARPARRHAPRAAGPGVARDRLPGGVARDLAGGRWSRGAHGADRRRGGDRPRDRTGRHPAADRSRTLARSRRPRPGGLRAGPAGEPAGGGGRRGGPAPAGVLGEPSRPVGPVADPRRIGARAGGAGRLARDGPGADGAAAGALRRAARAAGGAGAGGAGRGARGGRGGADGPAPRRAVADHRRGAGAAGPGRCQLVRRHLPAARTERLVLRAGMDEQRRPHQAHPGPYDVGAGPRRGDRSGRSGEEVRPVVEQPGPLRDVDEHRLGARWNAWLDRFGPPGGIRREIPLAVAVTAVTAALLGYTLGYAFPAQGLPVSPLLGWTAGSVACLQSLLLVLRRRYPLACFVVVVLVQLLLNSVPDFTIRAPVLVVAAYSLGSWCGVRRVRLAVAGAVVAEALVAGVLPEEPDRVLSTVDGALAALVIYGLPVLAGTAVAARRRYTDLLADRAENAISAQRASVQAALVAERTRMARELHDVAAHHLSGMVVQAAAVERLVERDPEAARAGAAWIRTQGRKTLDNLRLTVGMLRDTSAPAEGGLGDGAERTPTPGLASLEELVETARELGTEVTLIRRGSPIELPPVADIACFRVAQEALSNARQHAPGARVTILLELAPEEVRLDITDSGSPLAPGPRRSTPGVGLIGMRERAELIGAEFSAGPVEGGGWRVRLRVFVAEIDRASGADPDQEEVR
ncbi:serine hydrolase [Desertihabitans aurantiacus]|uniref:serine hydrolase n=1 Tax=Desertihabitans aurantiacus TaxID=2282477 RepID=UPI0018E51A8F|nr:serine hydrolase [Desertihabitans aurantiacus]